MFYISYYKDGQVHTLHEPPFDTGDAAGARMSALEPARGLFVVVEDRMMTLCWRTRERQRFDIGYYEPVPWSKETWHRERNLELFEHMSRKARGKISFTESEDKGARDIQAHGMRPGAFLTKYYGDILTASEIEKWANKCAPLEVRFTQDADEIQAIYENGPNSCMSYDAKVYIGRVHPARVYAGPDLAVAYLGPLDKPTARAVVWPDRKVFDRVYGGGVGQLQGELVALGYKRKEQAFIGARVQRIEHGDGFIMPYVDRVSYASDRGDYILLDDNGDIETSRQDGLSYDIDEALPLCDLCRESIEDLTYIPSTGDYWCDDCVFNDATRCDYSDELYPNDDVVKVHHHEHTHIALNNLERAGFVELENGGYWSISDLHACDICENYALNENITINEKFDRVCASCSDTQGFSTADAGVEGSPLLDLMYEPAQSCAHN